MIVEYSRIFLKDIQKINDKNTKQDLFDAISNFKNAENILEVANVKKLKGHSEVYRLRIGKYRLGFYYDTETIVLQRFVKREDIYKLFP